jgi:hypothetical protein
MLPHPLSRGTKLLLLQPDGRAMAHPKTVRKEKVLVGATAWDRHRSEATALGGAVVAAAGVRQVPAAMRQHRLLEDVRNKAEAGEERATIGGKAEPGRWVEAWRGWCNNSRIDSTDCDSNRTSSRWAYPCFTRCATSAYASLCLGRRKGPPLVLHVSIHSTLACQAPPYH